MVKSVNLDQTAVEIRVLFINSSLIWIYTVQEFRVNTQFYYSKTSKIQTLIVLNALANLNLILDTMYLDKKTYL